MPLVNKPGRALLSLLLATACEAGQIAPDDEPGAPDPTPGQPAAPAAEPEAPTLAAVAPEAPAHPYRLLLKPRPGRPSTQLGTRAGELGARLMGVYPTLGGVEVREVADASSLHDVIQRFWQSGDYEYVEPDYTLTPLGNPNDPKYLDGTQWNMSNSGQQSGVADADIDAPEAWNTRTDASSVVVAVIDSGINTTHEDLAGNLWVNTGEIAGNGIEDDDNGYIDDVNGINALTHSGDPRDDYSAGHGSHVAGIIGAVGNNGKGVSGVAWKAKLLACKIFNSGGGGSVSAAVACVDYARARGAKVINMSFESPYSYALRDAIAAARTAGIIVVAAAGNSARNTDGTPSYPSGYDFDNVLSVASTTRTDALATSSNWGPTSVDLAAPGEVIYSTHSASTTSYATMSGTSMAAPHVSGALALMIAQSPSSTYTQIINRLLATTDKPAALAGKTRSGRLNLANALGSTATKPVNDAFASRATYAAGACQAGASNADATAETGEPVHAGVAGGKSVWWTWTAPNTNKVTISTERSGLDTLLGVYTGSAVGSLTSVASNDNDGSLTTSRVSFTPVAGTVYQIAVDGKAGATGPITLSVLQAGVGQYNLADLGATANFPGPSQANDINSFGDMVGWVEKAGPVRTAARWTSAGASATCPPSAAPTPRRAP
jgi:subtilisin family serine protease